MNLNKDIHILGAGLSGLMLARCLRAKGFKAMTLWERDTLDTAKNRHGYAIRLHPGTIASLESIGAKQRLGVVGGDDGTGDVRVSRRKLEEGLREGLEGVVRWGMEVEGLETDDECKSRLRFKTSVEQADLVIAADGAHSSLRRAVLPETREFEILPFVVFNGKRRIARGEWEAKFRSSFAVPPHGERTVLSKRISNDNDSDVLLRLSIDDIEDERVSISYTYSRPARPDDDALYKPNRPNAGARAIPPEFFDELTAAFSSLDAGALKEVFTPAAVRKDRLLHWLMRSLLIPRQDLEKAAARGVLFIGDSVHHAPILGSEGANEGIKDAVEMADFLASLEDGDEGWEKWYAGGRWEGWEEGVVDGVQRLGEMHGT